MKSYFIKVKNTNPEMFYWNADRFYDNHSSYVKPIYTKESFFERFIKKYGWEYSTNKSVIKAYNNIPLDFRNNFEIIEREKSNFSCYKIINKDGRILSTIGRRYSWATNRGDGFVDNGGTVFVSRNSAIEFINSKLQDCCLLGIE